MEISQELSEFYKQLKAYREILTKPESVYVVDDGPDILRFLHKAPLKNRKKKQLKNSDND